MKKKAKANESTLFLLFIFDCVNATQWFFFHVSNVKWYRTINPNLNIARTPFTERLINLICHENTGSNHLTTKVVSHEAMDSKNVSCITR